MLVFLTKIANKIVTILEFTLAITIVGVPVGLPAVVTTTMAVGAAYLAKKQAIVQKVTLICFQNPALIWLTCPVVVSY